MLSYGWNRSRRSRIQRLEFPATVTSVCCRPCCIRKISCCILRRAATATSHQHAADLRREKGGEKNTRFRQFLSPAVWCFCHDRGLSKHFWLLPCKSLGPERKFLSRPRRRLVASGQYRFRKIASDLCRATRRLRSTTSSRSGSVVRVRMQISCKHGTWSSMAWRISKV